VCELSFAKFTAQVARKDPDIIGMPVYASRLFRFASFYVDRKAGSKTAKDLRRSASVPLVLTNVPELFARSSRRSRDHA
jgi:hypothetical protein